MGKTDEQIIQERYDDILENYIVSSAGYATATFLLGIGDRHLQNIMICGDGKLFHIDFGFIFGKEPNSFKQRYATKLRLSKEMLEPMVKNTTAKSIDPNYEKFERKFVESFLILRNKTSYMMNLIHLMIHSGIGDLAFVNHQKVLLDLYDRFLPKLNNEEAKKELFNILNQATDQLGVKVIEIFHDVGQIFK